MKCRKLYPILAGVALVVPDVGGYLIEHVKGISQVVPEGQIPREFRAEFREALAELRAQGPGHIEDDLEAERVTALYVMNHYLFVDPAAEGDAAWWHPRAGEASPWVDGLVREHWNHGPLARVEELIRALPRKSGEAAPTVIELGCGVGGLALRLRISTRACGGYLGVDSSFASIALARHLALGMPYPSAVRIPEDLLAGPVSRDISRELNARAAATERSGAYDFVVGDIQSSQYLPVARGQWDLSISLNAIDMLDRPEDLPALQRELTRVGGLAIQSCPYIWHESVAKRLRSRLPREVRDSARAVEWLYEQAGFKIRESIAHVPWLFFKHARQLEVYSVHLFLAERIS
jgi:SAM-dependent methyltransferase